MITLFYLKLKHYNYKFEKWLNNLYAITDKTTFKR